MQPYSQIVEHFIWDMNPKWFHCYTPLFQSSGERNTSTTH